ncbi:hypothetical protein ACFYW9_22970 [Streptomyces sp. NPDC002698]
MRLRLPGRVCLVLARRRKPDPEAARLRAAAQELCPTGWSHPGHELPGM